MNLRFELMNALNEAYASWPTRIAGMVLNRDNKAKYVHEGMEMNVAELYEWCAEMLPEADYYSFYTALATGRINLYSYDGDYEIRIHLVSVEKVEIDTILRYN